MNMLGYIGSPMKDGYITVVMGIPTYPLTTPPRILSGELGHGWGS